MSGKLVRSGLFLTYTEEKLRDIEFGDNSLDMIPKAQRNQKTNKQKKLYFIKTKNFLHQRVLSTHRMKIQPTGWEKTF